VADSTSVGRDRWALPAPGTLGIILLARTTINISHRVAYPFLPAISRGLGISLTAASVLITVRSLVGLSSPLFGPVSDRYGRRIIMLAALVVLSAGALLLTGMPIYAAAIAAFALFGISKAIYDPALQAYIGDLVPYQRRGRIMGITEFAWAASWLVGVPAAGYLIEWQDWRLPFAVIGVLAAASLLLTRRLPRADRQTSQHARLQWQSLLKNRSALSALAVGVLIMFANENVFVVYGAWMEDTFGLSVAALGVASVIIGVSEVVAEGAVAAFVDRIGKKRAVTGGIALTTTAYIALPTLTTNLTTALIGLAFLFVTFEFTIVSSLPLVSELAPEVRGTLMAANVAALSAGRMLGSLTAAPLWLAGGMHLNGAVSAAAMLASLTVLALLVREGG
jgi:predicted MFS family arabinose efflux permease